MKHKIIILLLVSSLSGCISTPTLSPDQRPAHWGTALNTTHNFYKISDTLYRSEQPNIELTPLLKQYDIQKVITLRSRNQTQELLNTHGIDVIHHPIHTWALSREDLLAVMQHIQQAEKSQQKVLIHCYHGSDRTGANVAMYRIVFQNWTIDDAVKEMKHGGYGFHAIWINIEKLFTSENVDWIKAELK